MTTGAQWIYRLRNSRGSGAVLLRKARAHHAVVPAVEVEVELQDLVPAGERAGEAHSHHRRLSARAGEADLLGARN